MKKTFGILLALISLSTVIFAQEQPSFRLSLGGGGSLTGNFSTWKVDPDIPGNLNRYNSDHLSVGPYVFFDMKYLELNLGLALGRLNGDDTQTGDPNFPARTIALKGGAYLKLPFALSPTFTLFPLLGVNYDLYLHAVKDDDRKATFPISSGTQEARPIEALNTLWFKGGVGLDSFFTDHIFLRTELLYGIRLPNNMENYLNDQRSDVDWKLGHGGSINIAIGYRF